jgi:mono/diheme cytochrome c family protein
MKAFSILLASSLLLAGAVQAQEAPQGSADNGKKLYEAVGCYQCHGRGAQGGPGYGGPRLGPKVMPYQNFVHQLRQPRNDMPPYDTPILADQAIADIYAFLKTMKEDDPKVVPAFY